MKAASAVVAMKAALVVVGGVISVVRHGHKRCGDNDVLIIPIAEDIVVVRIALELMIEPEGRMGRQQPECNESCRS